MSELGLYHRLHITYLFLSVLVFNLFTSLVKLFCFLSVRDIAPGLLMVPAQSVLCRSAGIAAKDGAWSNQVCNFIWEGSHHHLI